jgi:uncharacterized protein (DUF302 family)
MKITTLSLPVDDAAEKIKSFLQEKEFHIFADIDHQANAEYVELEMPKSRVIIFGNPLAGTKLMLKDIFMSLDLPIRLAVVEKNDKTHLIHLSTEDYSRQYKVEGHPVLEKIDNMFAALTAELT